MSSAQGRPSTIVNGTRSHIAALGSSVALLAAVVLACAALSGVVGSGGFPVASGEAGSSAVSVDTATVPDDLFAAADPLLDGSAPAGVATPDTAAGGDGGGAGGGGTGGGSADDPGASAGPGGDAGAVDDANGGGGTGAEAPGDDDPGPGSEQPPAEQPPPPAEEPPVQAPPNPTGGRGSAGPVGSTVEGVDDLVGGITGVDPGLGELTDPVTAPVDAIVGGLTGQGRP